jgi:hypothetical protein
MPERNNANNKSQPRASAGARLRLKLSKYADLDVNAPIEGESGKVLFWVAAISTAGFVGLAFAKANGHAFAGLTGTTVLLSWLAVRQHKNVCSNKICGGKDPPEPGPEPPGQKPTG